jgi:TPP-dependent pyruvate/acetoin dehydrogenase alpha subunit
MLQLLAPGSDIFTGGKVYAHPISGAQTNHHHSEAARPVCRQFRQRCRTGLTFEKQTGSPKPLVLCSFGDASMARKWVKPPGCCTEKLPIVYLVQNNGMGHQCNIHEPQNGPLNMQQVFGMERIEINGSDFECQLHATVFDMYVNTEHLISYRRAFLC